MAGGSLIEGHGSTSKSFILPAVNRQAGAAFKIRRTEDINDREWLLLRCAFWDGESEEEHYASLKKLTTIYAPYFAFIANGDDGEALGMAEISVRKDYVSGCETSPVLYLEGIFVPDQHRGRGISRALCAAAEEWGLAQGLSEFASDSDIDNDLSIKVHLGLGFEDVDRLVCFHKKLGKH